MQYNPHKSKEPVEGHQRSGGDGRRAGGCCKQFDSRQGAREMGKALLSQPQTFGQLHHRFSLEAQVFAGEITDCILLG